MLLSDVIDGTCRLAVVGLAKNTGKTVTLGGILRELAVAGGTVGVTSVGRDGEEHDVLDVRIDKPPVRLVAGSLVATTEGLLRASRVPHETLVRTGIRTAMGEVLLARTQGPGAVEIAGPSAAADVRAVSDAMLDAGAAQVLIDGAFDRRAASSPDVADGLVMATGAVLASGAEGVVARTRDAVDLVRLETLESATPEGMALRAVAASGLSMLVGPALEATPMPPRFVLTAEEGDVAQLLRERPEASWLIVAGALPELFLRGVAAVARREDRSVTVIVADPSKVFLSEHGIDHYTKAGVELRTLRPIDLRALTVNPVAPQSHRLGSARLRALLSEEIPGVPIFDVMDPEYRGSETAPPP